MARDRTPASSALAARRDAIGRHGRARRFAGAGVVMAAALALAWPAEAEAAPRDDRPWGKGTFVPAFGLGAGGFFSDIANVSFGLGFNYYLINGLSAGLSFSDTILIYRSALKAQYPGIEDSLPTNIFDITPTLRYVFLRSRRFSPYVFAGAGPVFFNHGKGTHGQWVAGPGVYFNVGGPLFVNVSVSFSSMFPVERCSDAMTYQSGTDQILLDVCSFQWGPQIGAVLAFGGGRRARQRRREQEEHQRRQESPTYYPPAGNPMDEVVEPEPLPSTTPVGDEVLSEGAPTDVAGPTEEAPTEEAPTDEAPTDVAPTDVAPPPADDAALPNEAPTDVAPPPADGTGPSEEAPTDVVPPPVE